MAGRASTVGPGPGSGLPGVAGCRGSRGTVAGRDPPAEQQLRRGGVGVPAGGGGWAMAVAAASAEEKFVHPALFYQGPREYLAGTVGFIREGLAAGEPVAVAVPEPRLRLLRDALGDSAER